ncbi:MAG TPA: hypothetical protein VIL88_10930 [Devosia sp.]|jgi:hypothetical protein|uniref:hypothetical protein n=1 Tax=Devosia sp. TaxID=1871048 RepID=UPI002F91DED9
MTSRGRPSFQPTDKDRRVVEMMAGWAIPEERIAKVLSIDPKTLRKHFVEELEVGHAKLEAQLAQNLLRIAQGHDRQSLIATIFALKSRFGWVEQPPPAREQPLGKKEAMLDAAQRAVSGTSRFAPPRPPPNYRGGGTPDEEMTS